MWYMLPIIDSLVIYLSALLWRLIQPALGVGEWCSLPQPPKKQKKPPKLKRLFLYLPSEQRGLQTGKEKFHYRLVNWNHPCCTVTHNGSQLLHQHLYQAFHLHATLYFLFRFQLN